MVAGETHEQQRELGAFLRAHRERLSPSAIGFAPGARRRTPGLRREEVAQLCGLSATWYTWIEQGRDVSVSPAALSRLARVLQLGRAERSYLFTLAGKRDPDLADAESDHVSPAALASVESIDCPAYILDRHWNAKRWNGKAARLFTGWLDRDGEKNLLRFLFLDPSARALICDWEHRARRVAGEFRAASSLHLNDPVQRALIDGLHQESKDFARFWAEHEVLGREGGERTFRHPKDGFLRYEQVTFALAEQPDWRLTMLLPEPGAK
jgi:transcriptional regulator with XRE-family HTH domain